MTDTKFTEALRRLTQQAIDESLAETETAMRRWIETYEQRGWLVEMVEPENNKAPCSRWWHPELGWVWDASKALRFARQQDAEDYIKSQNGLRGNATAHSWHCPPERIATRYDRFLDRVSERHPDLGAELKAAQRDYRTPTDSFECGAQ